MGQPSPDYYVKPESGRLPRIVPPNTVYCRWDWKEVFFPGQCASSRIQFAACRAPRGINLQNKPVREFIRRICKGTKKSIVVGGKGKLCAKVPAGTVYALDVNRDTPEPDDWDLLFPGEEAPQGNSYRVHKAPQGLNLRDPEVQIFLRQLERVGYQFPTE